MGIPIVVAISLLFLHSRFTWKHYLSVILCLIGIVIMIWSDIRKGLEEGTHRWIGDLMALGATFLYSVSNICQEFLVKSNDWVFFIFIFRFQ